MLTIIRPPVKYKALTTGDGDMGIYAIYINSVLTNASLKKKNANKLDTIFFKSTLISSYVKKNRVV
ncbi:MAG: hypothetical protein MOP49_72 [Nitrososphaera sp.]|jgi:hypothetical protein|nr:hypothetical protein [Nitrososphaera sp.]